MRPFHTIAVPHEDILKGRLTMDVFAADLWEVMQDRGAEEYRDADTFFRKTYLTQGLSNLLNVVEKRLSGQGGDPVIQLQTPFGGGKTHALIAMYHKTDHWKAKKAVIVGTALKPDETLWGLIEKQLTGRNAEFMGQATPGKEAIRNLLYDNQPVLILMDEILEYATKAATVKVGDSNLASQTMAFMQELTEAASTLDKVCVAMTLPSSIIEHYDEGAERLYQQLQKVAGRTEKIYTPVQESEITKIIRRRLFGNLNENELKNAVAEFIDFAQKESLIPPGTQPTEYRDRFSDSYPFMPEVIDILYHRWGSFTTFQRTRGVLRLLSMVIYLLKDANKPYISVADFNLADQDLRQELLKHIGQEYNSVIGADITNTDAGARKVDESLGQAYRGLKLGSRAAITIFLYSFSGGQERGVTLGEIKRSATTTDNFSSAVAEATTQLKSKLFYLQDSGERYFFSNQPNLNRILLTNMENIQEPELDDEELELLKAGLKGDNLKVFVWEENPANIPDTEELKLVILKGKDNKVIQEILKNKGQTPRVFRNTIFFLYPMESERSGFINALKRKIAYERIGQSKSIALSEDQRKEVTRELGKAQSGLRENIRRLYRVVAIPDKGSFKEADLGVPTYGEKMAIDQEVYNRLRADSEIMEKVAPIFLKEKYLSSKKYVNTEQLYQSFLTTPGEPRPVSKEALINGINEGLSRDVFWLGQLKEGRLTYIKENGNAELYGNEILISEPPPPEPTPDGNIPSPVKNVIVNPRDKQITVEWSAIPNATSYNIYWSSEPNVSKTTSQKTSGVTSPHTIRNLENGTTYYLIITAENSYGESESSEVINGTPSEEQIIKNKVHLRFQIPKGKVSGIMGMINLLQSKFDTLEIELTATGGEINNQDYEDKIEEALRQLGIKY
ncbi:DUF499 domain-containing protein [Candidatus Poribacteria bacterium]|nr:DUF499 domain-containing protein [Candidatus Poribacteria bacterium]